MQTIEDEINLFNSDFFKDVSEVSEDGLDFIANNHLHEPKENYTILFQFINVLLNHFKGLDYSVIDSTLSKLHRDVNDINTLYENLKNDASNIRDICKNQVFKKSQLITSIANDLNQYKKVTNISVKDKKKLKQDFSNFERLRIIYFELFQEIFVEDRDYFLSSLLHILNTKIYYLEKLLWIEASHSETIMKSLNKVQFTNKIGSQDYLQYKLKVIMPYSKDYTYFQKCLRIFK